MNIKRHLAGFILSVAVITVSAAPENDTVQNRAGTSDSGKQEYFRHKPDADYKDVFSYPPRSSSRNDTGGTLPKFNSERVHASDKISFWLNGNKANYDIGNIIGQQDIYHPPDAALFGMTEMGEPMIDQPLPGVLTTILICGGITLWHLCRRKKVPSPNHS